MFVRRDLEGEPEVRSCGPNMRPRERRTCLKSGPAEVYTAEHLLAALWALSVDNATISIDGEEVPGMDGSAREFTEALKAAGVQEQKVPRARYSVQEPVYVLAPRDLPSAGA